MKNVDIRFPRRQPQAVLLLVAALAALAVGFGLQVAVWRVRVPASQTRVLLLLFLFVYTVMGIALFGGLSVRSFPDLLYVSLLFWAPALCYVLLYTGAISICSSHDPNHPLESWGEHFLDLWSTVDASKP